MIKVMTEIFDNTVSRLGDRIAIADPVMSYTFSEVRENAQKTAAFVDGIAPQNTPVGVVAHRKAQTLPLFLGVLYSGRPYLPLDPELPTEKLQKILSDAGVTTVIASEDTDIVADGVILYTIDFDALHSTFVCSSVTENDLLYLIYTSGSTGTPKGVAKSHLAMADFISAYRDTFGFDEKTVIGNQTPFYFDASAKDIYLTVACGCRLEILPTSLFTFPVRLIEYMNERRVNFISWVPSALSIVTRMNTFTEVKPQYLERVFFVGEVFPVKQLTKWQKALPEVEYVNLYGSSELCGIACFKRIEGEINDADGIPLGRALSNCDVRLVEDGRVISTPDISGEIYIASAALADGYYKDPRRTDESFVKADLGGGERRWYRTGDIARYNSEGDLVFASRRDFQIKHMGHRIELGEIETVALTLEGVALCCCLYDKKRSRIHLYCECENGFELTDREILEMLKPRLAAYMVPHRVTVSGELPKNANGKIDRAALSGALNK